MDRQTIVVTGGGSGFGAALAAALSQRGANVVIAGRDEDRLARTAAGLDGTRSSYVVCDVTSADDLDRLWGASVDRFGHVDHWINNAGVGAPRHPLGDMPVSEVERVIRINLIGALLGARCAIREMRAQGRGHVWVTGGLGSSGPVTRPSRQASPGHLPCSRREVGETGVRIGYLRPGIMPTTVVTGHDAGGKDDGSTRMVNMPETIAPPFAHCILRRPRNGARLTWLTLSRPAGRLLLAPIRRRRIV